MTDWFRPVARRHALPLVALAALSAALPARADVYGRLRITVRADDNTPVPGANIIFHDPTGVQADFNAVTDAQGVALSPPLENHAWQITTRVVTFESDVRQLAVAADTTTDVAVRLTKRVITGASRVVFSRSRTTEATRRDLGFVTKFPATAGNPQSLSKLLITNPGFVQSSVNVVHPRGEHAATTIFINGFQLPGALQGRAGQVLNPQTVQSADVQTGGYAPEYGGETAAILNLSLRAGPITPFQTVTSDGGSFGTYDGEATFGGQAGAPTADAGGGPVPRRLRYLIDLSDRSTANVLEPPQPDDQTAHNHGTSAVLFGNFDYLAGPRDTLTLTLNAAPAHTQIANRTGLGAEYAPVGQEYGYGGARDADGTIPGGDPAALGGQTLPLPSQEAAGQDISQKDDNDFGVLNYRHGFGAGLTGLLSFGVTHSGLDITNRSPSIDLSSVNPDGTLTRIDNSIEYNPTLSRAFDQRQAAGSLTLTQGAHTYKAGFLLDSQGGDESYQFVPQSQLALDALAATDSRLTPAGAAQTDADGNPVTDVLGNPVYLIDPANPATPTLRLHRSGFYRAAYAQDSWNATHRLTLNYGARLDAYHQTQSDGQSISKTELSPRLNIGYAVAPRTLLRLSYNHLFTQPPLAQGAILGQPIRPETLDLYDTSLEQQLGAGQSVKVAYYYKNIRNQDDTGLLIPFTQIGAYTNLNYSHAAVHGLEVSYDLTPRGAGVGAFLAYAQSIAKASGVDQTGAPAPEINDHDQRHTLSAGLNYTLPSGAFVGTEVYYGSGEASSAVSSAFFDAALNDGRRTPHTTVNLRLESPNLARAGRLRLDVENLFDQRQVLNFNSGFSGTRFVQGRRVLLSLTGNF